MTSLTQTQFKVNAQPLILGEFTIRQDEDGRYSLNDLHKASGDLRKDRPSYFLENEKTLELIHAIKDENYDVGNSASYKQPVNIIRGRGKEQGTYVVKELVYSYAMWISAKFHLTVIHAYDAMVMQRKISDRQSISPEQKDTLQKIVDHKANGNHGLRPQIWTRHNRHFKINSYHELLSIHFEDAVKYLLEMEVKAKVVIEDKSNLIENDKNHNRSVQGLAWHMMWLNQWWRDFGEAIRTLNPNMAGSINDHFSDGAMFAFHFINKDDLKKQRERFEYHQWHLSFAERMALDYKRK